MKGGAKTRPEFAVRRCRTSVKSRWTPPPAARHDTAATCRRHSHPASPILAAGAVDARGRSALGRIAGGPGMPSHPGMPTQPEMPVVADPDASPAVRRRCRRCPCRGGWTSSCGSSPPLTVSLSLHLVVLLVLALWIVRTRKQERVTLDLSFAAPEVVEAPNPAAQLMPQPDPVEEPETEEVKTERRRWRTDGNAAAAGRPHRGPRSRRRRGCPPHGRRPRSATAAWRRRRRATVDACGGTMPNRGGGGAALEWLVKQQDRKDGLWSLQGPYADGGSQENRLAATAMALLAFQGAGNTPREGRHRRVVERGWKGAHREAAARRHVRLHAPDVRSSTQMYAHGQATIALCELYGMTKDPQHAEPARRARGLRGGGAEARRRLAVSTAAARQRQPRRHVGDRLVTDGAQERRDGGARRARGSVRGLTSFLDGVSVSAGEGLWLPDQAPAEGLRLPVRRSPPKALLCRQYLGWRRDDPRLVVGRRTAAAARPDRLRLPAQERVCVVLRDAGLPPRRRARVGRVERRMQEQLGRPR